MSAVDKTNTRHGFTAAEIQKIIYSLFVRDALDLYPAETIAQIRGRADKSDEPELPGIEPHSIVEVPPSTPITSVLLDDNPKTAFGAKKPGTAAIPPVAIIELGRAMHFGAVIKGYGRFNWRDKSVTTSVYTDAIDRHMLAFRDGEDIASDSAVHHLAHVMACCAIVIDAIHTGKINDDRRQDGVAAIAIDTYSGS